MLELPEFTNKREAEELAKVIKQIVDSTQK